jgi:imidazoleglycerol-phosphate dehydratase
MNLHLEVSGGDLHHVLEAIFKAFGIALDGATQIDTRRKEIPSTKGII